MCVVDFVQGALHVAVQNLDLPDHNGQCGTCCESGAFFRNELGRATCCCNYRRLFHGHRHCEVLPVYQEVQTQAERNGDLADAVLHHQFRTLKRKPAFCEIAHLHLRVDLLYLVKAFHHSLLVEARPELVVVAFLLLGFAV